MDLKDLYRDVIVDHNRHPRNFGKLEPADAHADGYNPLCGDRLSMYVNLEGDRIRDARFEGAGCAISVASASMLTEAVKGKSLTEVKELFDKMHALLTQHDASVDTDKLGKLAALSGVREFPARVKCASLCWHTLNAALDNRAGAAPAAVSTE
jgi:nitrogen fixation NifU-like protein